MQHTVDKAKDIVLKYQQQNIMYTRDEMERKVAAGMQDSNKGKKGVEQHAESAINVRHGLLQMRQLAAQMTWKNPNEAAAPCVLHGRHMNFECKDLKHPKYRADLVPRTAPPSYVPQQQQYGGAAMQGHSPMIGNPPGYGYAPAGAAQGYGAPPGIMPAGQPRWWDSIKQEQYGARPAPPPRPIAAATHAPVCECGLRDKPEDCYYRHPKKILHRNPYWRPSSRAPPAAISQLRQALVKLNIDPAKVIPEPVRLNQPRVNAAAAVAADNIASSSNTMSFEGTQQVP